MSFGNSDDYDGIDCIVVVEVEEEEESFWRSIFDIWFCKEDVKVVLVVDMMDICVGVEDIFCDDVMEDILEVEVLMDNLVVEDIEIGNLIDFD